MKSKLKSHEYLSKLNKINSIVPNEFLSVKLLCVFKEKQNVNWEKLVIDSQDKGINDVHKISFDEEEEWKHLFKMADTYIARKLEIWKLFQNSRCQKCTHFFNLKTNEPFSDYSCRQCSDSSSSSKIEVDETSTKSLKESLTPQFFQKCKNHHVHFLEFVCLEKDCQDKQLFCHSCKTKFHSKCSNYKTFKKIILHSKIDLSIDLKKWTRLLFINDFKVENTSSIKAFIDLKSKILLSLNYETYFEYWFYFSIEEDKAGEFIIKHKELENIKIEIEKIEMFFKNSDEQMILNINSSLLEISLIVKSELVLEKIINIEIDDKMSTVKNKNKKQEKLVSFTPKSNRLKKIKTITQFYSQPIPIDIDIDVPKESSLFKEKSDLKNFSTKTPNIDVFEQEIVELKMDSLPETNITIDPLLNAISQKTCLNIDKCKVNENQCIECTKLEKKVFDLESRISVLEKGFHMLNKKKHSLNIQTSTSNITKKVRTVGDGMFSYGLFKKSKLIRVLVLSTDKNSLDESEFKKIASLQNTHFNFTKMSPRNISYVSTDTFDCVLLTSFDYSREEMGKKLNRFIEKGINVVFAGYPIEDAFYPKCGFQGPLVPGSFDNNIQSYKVLNKGLGIFNDIGSIEDYNIKYRIISTLNKIGQCDLIAEWADGKPFVAVRWDLNALVTFVGICISNTSTQNELKLILNILRLGKGFMGKHGK